MLTEEQIQRLAKKISEEHGDDEEQCEKHVRFIDTVSEMFHVLLPEDKKELYKKPSKENSLKASFKGVSV